MHPKERWSQCYYLSSTSNIADRYLDCFGFVLSLAGHGDGRRGFSFVHLDAGRPWCLDNGVFTGRFGPERWIGKLEVLTSYVGTCLFVVVPDAVGDSAQTIKQFAEYAPMVREFGYPLAFVSQDGLTIEDTPWDQFDVLFVGGTDKHKLGPEAGALIAAGIERGKRIHIGRVNSPKRMRQFWRADSWDGTHIGYEPDRATPRIAAAVREIRVWQQARRLI